MKRLLILPFMLLPFMVLPACGTDDEALPITGQSQSPDNDEENGEDSGNDDNSMESNQIKLTVNGRSFTATLADNTSAEALKSHLEQNDLHIRMDDYGDMEKVGSLGFSLPRNDQQTTTSPGDIILYLGNSLVIYYDTNSWNFTRIGRVNGVSTREEMLSLLGGKGEITVTLSLE